MKKVIFFVLLLLVFVIPTSAFASTFYNAGASSPQSVMVYGKNTWSNVGKWDLTNDSNIPNGATIDLISEAWNLCTSCGMIPSSTNVALFNGAGTGYYVSSGIYISNFSGNAAKQVWNTQYWVSNTLVGGSGWIQPVLRLYWNNPATGTSGVTTLNSDGTSTTTSTPNNETVIVAQKASSSDAEKYNINN